jgi:ankyrin repeat protein
MFVFFLFRISSIEAVLLAYHRDTDLSHQLGWFHEIIQGTFHSAAYLGDSVLLRRHLRAVSTRAHSGSSTGIDAVDESGMTALHWAVLRDHEVCVRILLDRGADVDALQKGLNTPLLLAAVSPTGSETISRLLIERGADLSARNLKDHDAVFMAVLYGHASKGLPWLLQLLNTKGLDLNAPDGAGATPLHLCAKKNLARPIRMLVDSGADVNAKHGTTQLTPLQMACGHSEPDVETVRSFLDKGAYPNWRDLQGRTAFDIVLYTQQQKQQQLVNPAALHVPLSQSVLLSEAKASSFASPGSNFAALQQQQLTRSLNDIRADSEGDGTRDDDSSDGASYDGEPTMSTTSAYSPQKTAPAFTLGGKKSASGSGNALLNSGSKKVASSTASGSGTGGIGSSASNAGGSGPPVLNNDPSQRWRAMESTIKLVGDWAVKALPVLLEISKRGGRCRPQSEALLQSLRPSFRAAVEEAQQVWRKSKMPPNFLEFVVVREHSGEDLRLHKTNWTKDNSSPICQLCSETFSIRVRRHHCRSCGGVCCDDCSSKRLTLTAVNMSEREVAAAAAQATTNSNSNNNDSSAAREGGNNVGESGSMERVCMGCFNRLCHEAAQPSPDHFRVKQLKRCALDVIQSLEALVDSLDDPEGESGSAFQNSLRETAQLTKNLDALAIGGSSKLTSPTFANREGNAGVEEGLPRHDKPKKTFSFKFGSSSTKRASLSTATPPPPPSPAGQGHSGTPTSVAKATGNRLSAPSGGLAGGSANVDTLINALKQREAKLQRAEDLMAKFMEVSLVKSFCFCFFHDHLFKILCLIAIGIGRLSKSKQKVDRTETGVQPLMGWC